MGLFSKMEIIIMALLLGSLLLIIMLLTVLDMIDEHKERKNKKLDDKILEEEKIDNKLEVSINEDNNHNNEILEEEIEVLDFNEPVIEMKEEINNNEVVVESSKQDIFEYEEISINEENNAKKILNSLEEELSKETSIEDTITNFEIEQEENAIISYDELIKVSDKLYDQNSFKQYDDGDEPITIDEVIKKFSTTDMVFENTANYDKLNRSLGENDNELMESYKNE